MDSIPEGFLHALRKRECVRARVKEGEGACVSAQVHGAMIHQTVARCVYMRFLLHQRESVESKVGERVRVRKGEREGGR